MKLALVASIVTAIASCIWAASVLAAPGSLDTSFGTNGLTVTDIPGATNDQASDMVLDSHGRIVVVGSSNNQMFVTRHTPDGAVDTAFSGDGIQQFSVEGAVNAALAVAVQSDGKIVVAGLAQGAADEFGVARLNDDGSLDTTFDGDGLKAIDFGAGGEQANALAIQSDGKIVLAGYVGGRHFAAARLNSDGSLDTSFDGDGLVSTSLDGSASEEASSVSIQSDGKILLSGIAAVGGNSIALVRYKSDGSLDDSYDGDGKLVISPSSPAVGSVTDMALNSDNSAVISGETSAVSDTSMFIIKVTPAGAVDTSFGTSGIAQTNVTATEDRAQGVSIDPDGRIVLAASVGVPGAPTAGETAIARYESNGSIDNTFGTSGIVRKDWSATFDGAVAVHRQSSNGKYVVAGFGFSGVEEKILLSRFDGDVVDLSVTSAFDRSSYTLGDNATLTIKISNAGPQSAAGVTLKEALPSGASFVSAAPSQGTCSNGTTLDCSLGSIAASSSATVVVVMKASAAGTTSDSARVSTLTFDSNSQNDTATSALVVNAPPVADTSDKHKPKLILRILTKKLRVVGRSRRIGVRIGTDEPVKGLLRLKMAGSGRTMVKKSIILTKKGAKSFILKISRKNYLKLKRKARVGGKRKPYAKIQAILEAADTAGNKATKKAKGKLHR